ncbi:phage tail tape measure protein [Cellulosilyticum sp. WCF-2]|uniref:phage tail tape measure protein n=1 Tax=Cellulosilyticum sp. WCF-2 TaxID=2497860 RepID=UPI000F8F403B|nr:phage tail tape measure protein [Cellulosilyticum sp. WCF-2]QEH69716.1 phage tail tape measure protein [Cellulosilyticum sp. WCF-2]
MADGSIIIDTQLNNKGFKDGLNGLKGLADKGLGGLKDLAAGVTKTIAAVGAALATAAGFAIKAGIEFESAFAGVKKTVNGTEEQLASLEGAIRNMAKEMPQSAAEIAGVAEAAGQLGISIDKIDSFTKTMVQLGDATNLSSEEAATSLARLANITGMSQDDFDKLGSTIVALGNNLATTESEITAMSLRLAGAGKQVGMSEAQILSLAGGLSSVGIEAEAGGSAFSKVMSDMALAVETGNSSLGQFAAVAGMSSEQFKKAFKDDAAGAIMSFIQGLGTAEDRGISAIKVLDDMGITEIRLKDALLRASSASDVFAKSMDIGNTAWSDNSALAKEASARYATMESQIGILKNKVTDLGITFYKDLNNPLTEIVKTANDMLDQLAEAFEKGGLEGLVVALGDVFSEVVVQVAAAAPKMIEAASNLIQSFIQGLSDNLETISSAAIEMGMSLVRGIGEIIPKLLELGVDIIKALGKGIQENIAEIVGIAKNIIMSLVDSFVQIMPTLLQTGLAIILELGKGIAEALPKLIPTAVETILNFIDYLLEDDNIDALIDCAVEIISALADGIVKSIPILVEKAPEIIVALADALIKAAVKLIECADEVMNKFKEGIMEIDWAGVGKDIIDEIGEGILGAGQDLPGILAKGIRLNLKQFGLIGLLADKGLDALGIGKDTIDSTLHKSSSGRYHGGKGASFDKPSSNEPLDLTEYDKNAQGYLKHIQDIMDQGAKEYQEKIEEKAKENQEAIDQAANDAALKLNDASEEYARLEQDLEVKRSEEYLALKEKLSAEELKQLEKELAEKEAIGVARVQKAYNKYIAIEKAKVTEKEKAISDLEAKLDKQNKAMSIASESKDLEGAYRVLAKLEIELMEDLDEETKAQKLKDIEAKAKSVTEKELNALAESNQAKLELTKQGLEDEKALQEQYVKNYESTYSGMISAYENAYQTIMSKQTSLEEKFKAFGDLFDKFTEQNDKGEDVEFMKLGDLKDDINQLTLFGKGLDALKQKGASQDFLETITNMNMEDALDFTELLLAQSDKDFQSYLSLWEEKQKLAGELASGFYKDEFDTLKTEFTDKVNDELGLMPDEAQKIGQDTASKLAEGLRSGVDMVRGAVGELVAQMQAAVAGETASIGANLSTSSNVTQNVNTKDNGVIGALSAIYGALTEEVGAPIIVNMNADKVGEGSVDGMLRELRRRGVTFDVD